MNSRGFLMYAEGDAYIRQAYLCAMSIRATNNLYPVSIVTSDTVPEEYTWIFDKIIEIPWYKKTESRFKTEHRWKLYHATPYDETIVLDTDVLVLQELDYLWNFFNNYNIYYPTRVFTYRKDLVTSNFYRKAFTANNLPNIYNALHFFRKCEQSKEYFAWLELISNNWELFYGHFCKDHYPKAPSMDVTCAIAAKIMDIDVEITNAKQDMPMLVHMKPLIQGWVNEVSNWKDKVGTYLTDDLKLKIGNHLQDTVFHYVDNEFVTDTIIRKYEQCLK
tara:strand:- start:10753 stop:11580 length:828 start_codon:yes stop_codon:yes gene_type:complete